MRARKTTLIFVLLFGTVALAALLAWPRRCPVELRVVKMEGSGITDENDRENPLVTISVANHDRVEMMFDNNDHFEAFNGARWVRVEQQFRWPRIHPGHETTVLLLVPSDSTACRFHLRYQCETWKSRFVAGIGVNGRKLVARSRLLRRMLWPDQWKTMPNPPRWKHATIEVKLPQSTK